MSWNYRVIRHKQWEDNIVGGTLDRHDPYFFNIHEVYYDNQGYPKSWSMDPHPPGGCTLKELQDEVQKMASAWEKPVLEESLDGQTLVEVEDLRCENGLNPHRKGLTSSDPC